MKTRTFYLTWTWIGKPTR